MAGIARRCFISYHHADQTEVDRFIRTFDSTHSAFSARGLGQEMDPDIVQSTNTDYVMRRIRERYLRGTSVTLVMLGRCTWARRYADWETQASLYRAAGSPPNGLLAIKLPSWQDGWAFPDRLNMNLLSSEKQAAGATQCYARHMPYPQTVEALQAAIEEAYTRRENQADLIVNPRDRLSYNRQC